MASNTSTESVPSSPACITNASSILPSSPYAISVSNIKNLVPTVLDYTNYMLWRELFLPVFKGHGVYGFIDGSFPCPEPTILHDDGNSIQNPSFQQWIQLDSIVLSWIQATISQEILQAIIKPNYSLTSRDVWLQIERLFRDQKGDLSINEYVHRLKSIVDALTSIGNPISEYDLVLQILSGLTPEYMFVSASISTRVPLPTFIEARSLLFLHEAQLSSLSNSTTDNSITAFMAKQQSPPSYGRGRGRHNNGPPPISYPAAFNPSQPNNVTLYCQLCYQPHHTARDCPSQNSKPLSPILVLTTHVLHLVMPLDRVVVGNGTQLPISYIGHGIFSTSDSLFSLRDILVVPHLSTNLLSVHKFVSDNNCSMEFDPFGLSIKELKTKKHLLRCNSSGPLYALTSSSAGFAATRRPAIAATHVSPNLWHRCLGHPSSAILASFIRVNKLPSSAFKDIAILLLYVDDILLTVSPTTLLQSLIQTLKSEFSMNDLGLVNYFLGVSITAHDGGYFLSQSKYVKELLGRANLLSSKPVSTHLSLKSLQHSDDSSPFSDPTLYRSLVGGLQYLTFTCPDIVFAVNQVSQFMHSPLDIHYTAVKRILRYLYGSLSHGLFIPGGSIDSLHCYSDANWAGCSITRRSTSAYFAHAAAAITWLHSLLKELHVSSSSPSTIFCDNISSIYLAQNPVQHARSKHVEIDIHFVREKVAAGIL
ncbi:uncharacterized protein LOC142165046 [Nicotiana tabacum]|uniref:Uncharacterized protein LOC142165046 n=1 Tax=Nicotiana tabacum TaxID=4097 RepID=A0AC58S473_TOBAC